MASQNNDTQKLRAPAWVHEIAASVAEEYGMDVKEITDLDRINQDGRHKRRARQHIMYLVRQRVLPTGLVPSYNMIGRWMGGLHHTTVLHGIRMHEARMKAMVERELRDAA